MTDQNQEVGSQTDIETPDVASHSDNTQEQDGTAVAEIASARALFGLTEAETPEEPEDQPADDAELDDDDAIEDEDVEERPRDQKGRYVKYNKEEVFVPEEEYDERIRKGLNYEKVEGRAKTYESALDRIAKVQGFKDHADLLANIDTMEEQRVQQEKNQFDQLTEHLRQSAYDAGIDPEALDQWLDNHPLLKEAKEAAAYRETERQRQEQERIQQQQSQGWADLLAKYPDLEKQIHDNGEGGVTVVFITPEMAQLLDQGYQPIHAYQLTHMDSMVQQSRKKTEQQVLKQQRLNKRSAVEPAGGSTKQSPVPTEVEEAFKLMGLNPDAAQKYFKK